MLLERSRTMTILFALVIAAMAGCSAKEPGNVGVRKTPSLLFGSERSTVLATEIGRNEWPTTDGPVESLEDTIYVEYYRDYTGPDFAERSNPHRQFRSYRVGAQVR